MKFGDDNYQSLETREPLPALKVGGLPMFPVIAASRAELVKRARINVLAGMA